MTTCNIFEPANAQEDEYVEKLGLPGDGWYRRHPRSLKLD